MSQAALIKNPSPRVKLFFNLAFWALMGLSVGYVFRSCGKKTSVGGSNSFLTGARMVPAPVIIIDTTAKPKVDSVALWNAHIDSVLTHTSLRDFDNWIQSVATIKQYKEGTFQDFVNSFIQYQYSLWLSKKPKQ